MADKQQQQGSGEVETNTFNKGMSKDYNDSFIGEGVYTHARNAVNNSHDGQVGVIGNEPSTLLCSILPYPLIGCIHLYDDQWAIFTTDDYDSEIGIFDESECSYKTLVNDPCLDFKQTNLITGVYRKRYDCERIIYWDDGRNPTRTMDIDNIPWAQNCITVGNCTTCTDDLNFLNCEKLRLVPLIKHPCISIEKGNIGGTIPNGTFQACIAYTINQVKVTDFIGLTQPLGVFSHENTSSSLVITITDIDTTFDEFELVINGYVNAQNVAKQIGFYSTSQGTIHIDRWSTEFVNIDPGSIMFRSEPIERSDAMYPVNNYLLRTGIYSKFKFNYQPLANQIRTEWVAVQYPSDYYIKGNINAGYLRDEQYAFFIRFIYNTGETSESYHIPGRAPLPSDRAPAPLNDDYYESYALNPIGRETWQVTNTAFVTGNPSYLLKDGGYVVATGKMGFWESEERYPGDRYDIWGNLCGEKIRHHKMPDDTVPNMLPFFQGTDIRLLGVQFSNVQQPLDLNGQPIASVVGYEILRGSREGNKTIIAKGIFNNMLGDFNLPGNSSRGIMQNYPYNDLHPDEYLTEDVQNGTNGQANVRSTPMHKSRNDIFSFHSPDTTFSNPYLAVNEVKLYQEFVGTSNGYFEHSYLHPRHKEVTDLIQFVTTIIQLMDDIIVLQSAFDSPITIEFTGTEDIPTAFSFTTPKLPKWSDIQVGGGNLSVWAILAFKIAYFVVEIAAYAVTLVACVLLIQALQDAKQQKIYGIFLFLCPKVDFSAQYKSHGFYDSSIPISIPSNTRRSIDNSAYVGTGLQMFGGYQINNLNRNKFVAVKINKTFQPTTKDNSRFIKGGYPLGQNAQRTIASYYGALKVPMDTQYGQLEQIKQIPISTCVTPVTQTMTDVLFGGDIYINRFTEKNTMMFFTNWLQGEPDMIPFNYIDYVNVPFPRFWLNTQEHKVSTFIPNVPSDFRSIDYKQQGSIAFIPAFVKEGYFYLFNSGVRDFFVESEVNVAYRDWEEGVSYRHYDYNTYTDLNAMFRGDIIRSGNYYKYDYALSISKLSGSHVSWGNMLPRDYYPNTYSTCYTYRPNRVIYSLPQQDQSKQDAWRVFLVNNYKDFTSPVTSIKSINKTGSLFMMKYMSPMSFMGVEELTTTATLAKIIIGDGGLFKQALQAVVNADESYEFGSNQGRYCSINTKYGVFWVSQNQGKVFNHAGQLDEISNSGMKWWFAKYLPSDLLKQYPSFGLADNPLIGVSVQMIYDNTHEIIYITKKDYKPKFTKADGLDIDPLDSNRFLFNNVPVQLTDTTYFEPASFTISYDPKSKTWVSFHDWIPTFLIPGKLHFMSVNKDEIWKHNTVCDNYCKFYGVDYPFEVEFVTTTGQTVNTVRSIEYMLETYTIHNDCRDKFHVLDQNFDQAIIYNSEQISGLLKLNIKTKNDPLNLLNYPIINSNPDYIDIQFSKEENKYRFNQFWDITNNRGEYAPFNLPMFATEPNGYIYPINPLYVDYNKSPIERKKFRHNTNKVFLRRFKSENYKFLFKLSNQKLLQSPR